MRRKPRNRYLELAATQTSPVPAPGKAWSEKELREIRIQQARENERAWAAQREALIERRPNVDLRMLARLNPQLRELDEALESVREWLADLDGD